jgi:predicted DNA-binding transcriptional regulator YafY
MNLEPLQVVTIRYTNHRGETADRRILPRLLRFASSEWHPHPQWLLDAFDVEKGAERSFAMQGIHSWQG